MFTYNAEPFMNSFVPSNYMISELHVNLIYDMDMSYNDSNINGGVMPILWSFFLLAQAHASYHY